MTQIVDYRDAFLKYHVQQSSYVNYAIQTVMYIVAAVGPRGSGTVSELNAQKFMLADLRNYCDTVNLESFTYNQYAFQGFLPICSILLVLGVFLYNFKFKWIPLFCTTASLVLFFGEFFMYKEFCDCLFPVAESHNVVAVRKAAGEVKRVIIFNGHCDSMWQWNFNYLGGGHFLVFMIVMTLGGVFILEILQIIFICEYKNWLALLSIFFLPFFLAIAYFADFTLPVEGANDNLTGCATVMAVAKYLYDNKITFENTEVRFVLTGCEEAGLRGAKRYAEAHPYEEETKNGVEVAFFCFDTMRDLNSMSVYYKDMTGTVSHDLRVCNIMKRAGLLGGIELPFATVYCGASDAAAMTQAGYPSATFAAMDPTPASYYHTKRDTIEIMEPIALGHALDVAMGSLFIFDEEGLNGQNKIHTA